MGVSLILEVTIGVTICYKGVNMQIELYKFSKRINSTKRPTSGSGFTTQCTIKQNAPYVGKFGSSSDTTVCYPVLFLAGVQDPNQYNYCKTFDDRYYFIRDIQVDINGAATLHCEIDVLATRKTEILASRQYVEYASSGNSDIIDPRNPATARTKIKMGLPASFPFEIRNGGTYVMQTVTGSADAPFITTYAMMPASAIMCGMYFCDNEELWEYLQKLFASAFDCIKSFYWTPLDMTKFGFSDTIKFGTDDSMIPATNISGIYVDGQVAGTAIPRGYNDYRKSSSFSSYGIYIPFCGQYSLSADDLFEEEVLLVNMRLDTRTGQICGAITTGNDNNKILQVISGGVYSQCTVGQTTSNTEKMFNVAGVGAAAIGTVATMGVAAGAGIVGAGSVIGAGFGGVAATGSALLGQAQAVGGATGTGIGNAPGNSIIAYCTYKTSAYSPGANADIIGVPVMAVRTLSGLSGYCQCKNPSVEINDLKIIAELINQYLSSGFFIE